MGKKYFFDKPKNVKGLLKVFYVTLLLLLVIDPFIHKHPYFSWEEMPQFYAVFGFIACVCLVLVAKYILRPIVKRKEDYYD
jgi:asparagine N-glycosylation enzyme membrane subunit Stt3